MLCGSRSVSRCLVSRPTQGAARLRVSAEIDRQTIPLQGHGWSPAGRSRPILLAVAWAACIAAIYAIISATGYSLRDADSTLYESIAQQLSGRPLHEWIVP